MNNKEINPLESEEQIKIFQWAAWSSHKYPELKLLFHIPNGGSRNVAEAVNLKRQGVKRGVPDIFLPCARKAHHGLFIELKRQKGGNLSPEQQNWIKALNEAGYLAIVCYGGDDAIRQIIAYLS